jgi:hypothetical protein
VAIRLTNTAERFVLVVDGGSEMSPTKKPKLRVAASSTEDPKTARA